MGHRDTKDHREPNKNVDPKDMVDEIDAIRERLADTIDTFISRSHPKSIAQRSLADLKAKFVDETGSPRLETIVPVVAAVAGTIAALVVIRRIAR